MEEEDRFPLAAVYAVLFLLGAALGIWGAFLVPLRLPGGLEGLSDVLAFAGNVAVGYFAARGARNVPAAAMPGIGWLIAVLVVGTYVNPADEVVIPGKLPTDPGIGTVGNLYLLLGAVGAMAAILLANRDRGRWEKVPDAKGANRTRPLHSRVCATDGMKVTLAPAPANQAGESIAAAERPDDAVIVRLGDGRFAVALEQVAEVGKVPIVTRVPGAPGWVAGVVNWRGRVLAVLDLGALLGADPGVRCTTTRLVVLVTESATVGVLVDAVVGTAALGSDHEPVPSALSGVGADLVRGQVPRDDGPVAVLDVDALIRLRDQLPRRRTMSEEGSWTSPSG